MVYTKDGSVLASSVLVYALVRYLRTGFSCRRQLVERRVFGQPRVTLALFAAGCLASGTTLKTTCTLTQGSGPSLALFVAWGSHRSQT